MLSRCELHEWVLSQGFPVKVNPANGWRREGRNKGSVVQEQEKLVSCGFGSGRIWSYGFELACCFKIHMHICSRELLSYKSNCHVPFILSLACNFELQKHPIGLQMPLIFPTLVFLLSTFHSLLLNKITESHLIF